MRHACVVCGAPTFFYPTYHGSRGLPIEEESGGSGCECNRGREGEAEEEQESNVPGTKEKGNRRGLAGGLTWLAWLAGAIICSAPLSSLERDSVCVCGSDICIPSCVFCSFCFVLTLVTLSSKHVCEIRWKSCMHIPPFVCDDVS